MRASRGLHSAAMRARVGWSIAVLALVLALGGPASAQQAPTLGAPPTPDVTVNSGPATTLGSTTGNGGLKTWQEALIFAAGIILIRGIGIALPPRRHPHRDPRRLARARRPPLARPRRDRAGRGAAPPQAAQQAAGAREG